MRKAHTKISLSTGFPRQVSAAQRTCGAVCQLWWWNYYPLAWILFYVCFPFSLQHHPWKVLITHICPRLSPLKEKQQQYHSPAAIGARVRAFQEKHSDNTALECLSRKSSLGALACFLDSAIFSLRQFRACPVASWRGRKSTACSGEKRIEVFYNIGMKWPEKLTGYDSFKLESGNSLPLSARLVGSRGQGDLNPCLLREGTEIISLKHSKGDLNLNLYQKWLSTGADYSVTVCNHQFRRHICWLYLRRFSPVSSRWCRWLLRENTHLCFVWLPKVSIPTIEMPISGS